ncbi:MAG TPA: MFS transporter [Polyangiaceae bacterium]
MNESEKTNRNLAWGLSWVAYASYYTGRKGFSVAKKSIVDQLGVSTTALGVIDTLFLGAYAVGQFGSGVLGDRVGARRLIGFGMLASAGLCVGFGSAGGAVLFGLFFLLNGFAQSTGWPGTTRTMAEWTTPRDRATVMGFWGTCYQVGGIFAGFFSGWLLGHYGWRAAFYGPALWMTLVAVAVLSWLPRGGARGSSGDNVTPTRAAVRALQWEVVKKRVLWSYGLAYFFIKFIRYSLLFWLPFYLSQVHGHAGDTAAYIAVGFEAGGTVGAICAGLISDRVRVPRGAVAMVFLLGLAGALLLYARYSTPDPWTNAALLALVGAALFGPDSLISGAAAQDAGGPNAAAMATGFVNGVGSLGALLEGLLVPRIADAWGWSALFPVLVVLGLLAALALLPTLRHGRAVG